MLKNLFNPAVVLLSTSVASHSSSFSNSIEHFVRAGIAE